MTHTISYIQTADGWRWKIYIGGKKEAHGEVRGNKHDAIREATDMAKSLNDMGKRDN